MASQMSPAVWRESLRGRSVGRGKPARLGVQGQSPACRQLSLGLGFPIGNTGELDETGNTEVRGPVDEGPAAA